MTESGRIDEMKWRKKHEAEAEMKERIVRKVRQRGKDETKREEGEKKIKTKCSA